jgi:hypothetical protein
MWKNSQYSITQKPQKTGGDIFIVDNSDDDWKVVRYLHEWAEIAHQFDIATGYFEIGRGQAAKRSSQKSTSARSKRSPRSSAGVLSAMMRTIRRWCATFSAALICFSPYEPLCFNSS